MIKELKEILDMFGIKSTNLSESVKILKVRLENLITKEPLISSLEQEIDNLKEQINETPVE